MIELNLLPDVKLEYLKAQRSKRLILSVSFLVSAAAIVILVLLLGVDFAQKKHLNDLNRDISTESSQLQNEPQIGKILTVQNQLESLTNLHAGKPAASRLFDASGSAASFLDQLTPGTVSISDFQIDFTQQTATITGAADSLSSIDQYIDTLKFTNYTSNTVTTQTPAFSNVVLSSFGLNSGAQDKNQAASFTVTLSYDKNLFDITQNVQLDVPNLITTRSHLAQPGDLFKAAPPSSSSTSTSGGGH